jgi:hypothetical protein
MRVIACGPGYHGKYREFYYSFDKKIINGLIRAGHSVVPFSDRQITRSVGGMKAIGKLAVERQLLNLAYAYSPDVILLLHADQVSNSALSAIRQQHPHCRIVNIDCDLIMGDERERRIRNRKGYVDLTLITSAGEPLERIRRDGLRAAFIPNPTDTSIEDANVYADPDKFFDLIYVCASFKDHARWDLMRTIAREAPDLKLGSFGADKRRVYGIDYFNVLKQGRCALNWSARNDVSLYASDRIAQLFGVGSCVCLLRSAGFDRFLGESDAIFFDDADDLARRVRQASASHEWRAIAQSGQSTYRRLFNGTRVAQYAIDRLFESPLDEYEWGAI